MSENRRNILIINPGSTSTKIALYKDGQPAFVKNFAHSREEVAACATWLEQVPFRAQALRNFISEFGITKDDIDFIVPRYIVGSAATYPGHYTVNEALIDYIRSGRNAFHIMSITPMIAYEVFGLDVPMAVCSYDSYLGIDPVLTVTGIPGIRRSVTKCHMENITAVSGKVAQEAGRAKNELSIIVAHLGGGCSFAWVNKGVISYTMFDGETCMTPERSGAVPALPLVDLCYSGEFTKEQMVKKIKGAGGLVAHFGTNDALEIEKRAIAGDEQAKLIYDGMLVQAAGCIGEIAAVAKGKVDYIAITGGLARGKYVTDRIAEHVGFIAPVKVYPGEFEMESFASFGESVLNGDIPVSAFDPALIKE